MDGLIINLQAADRTVQALAVTVGGLIGVFTTLALFFLIIWIADKTGKKGE
jgi:hypothetical protein